MDWPNEYKLCLLIITDKMSFCGILGSITKGKLIKDVSILLVEEYGSTVDIIERTMKDLHTFFYCECYTGNKLSGLSQDLKKKKWFWHQAIFFFFFSPSR
jgi:hypothetical protein